MAEYLERKGCPQRDNAEHEEYAGAHRSFRRIWKERDSAQPELLEKILDRHNLNRAFKRVKANKGAPGIDGKTIEDTRAYLMEDNHARELVERIKRGKYTPSPVRRVEIPKPDGGVRKLGIPTVTDRTIQQAMAQQLMPIYEPLFAEGSYGYRPGRSAKDAILKVKEYAERGYTYVVVLDLSKYFDTLDHNLLLNILRRTIDDERVIQLIKRFLKSGVMESGVHIRVHPKAWKKMKAKLKEIASRRDVRNVHASLDKIKRFMRGWLNYYGIADMKNPIEDLNHWLYHRIRMCIWKHWRLPRTKIRNLCKLGVPFQTACKAGNCRRGYWWTSNTVAVKMAMTKERLVRSGFYDLARAYQSVHVKY